MGKNDRYNVDGVDDDLGSSSEPPNTDEQSDNSTKQTEQTASPTTTGAGSSVTTTESPSPSSADELPHRVRYDSPKDERTAKTFYLDDEEDIGRIRELQTAAEGKFDEKVHQLDVYLAAFRSDLSEEGFLEEMRKIGYGYFD
jgi:hypothetical protein